MTRTPTVKLRLYLALTALGAIASLATGHVAFVAVLAPFGVFVAVGIALAGRPHVAVSAQLNRSRGVKRGKPQWRIPLSAGPSGVELPCWSELAVGAAIERQNEVVRGAVGLREHSSRRQQRCTECAARRCRDRRYRRSESDRHAPVPAMKF